MNMYREPLPYSVWHFNGNVRDELIAYFTDLDKAKEYVDRASDISAVFDVKTDKQIYPQIVPEEFADVYKQCQKIRQLYNIGRGDLPEATTLTESDMLNIKTQLQKYTVRDFMELFHTAWSNCCLNGLYNDHRWTASFEWLIIPENMDRVLSGYYPAHPWKDENFDINEILGGQK